MAEAKKEKAAAVADGFDRLDEHDASLTEFPSLHGQPAVEVAERTVDDADQGKNVHRKVFVLLAREVGDDFDHEPNKGATLRYMLQNGLRPTGDVTFNGFENLPDGKSIALIYTVPAVPAIVAEGDPAHLVIE